LVFWVAFRDGSPEQDDLSHYTRLVQHHLNIRRGYEDDAEQLEQQIELIRGRIYRNSSRVFLDASGSAHNVTGNMPTRRWAMQSHGDPTTIENRGRS